MIQLLSQSVKITYRLEAVRPVMPVIFPMILHQNEFRRAYISCVENVSIRPADTPIYASTHQLRSVKSLLYWVTVVKAPTVANVMFTNVLTMLTVANAGTPNADYHISIELDKFGNIQLTTQRKRQNATLKTLVEIATATCQARMKMMAALIATMWTQMTWRKISRCLQRMLTLAPSLNKLTLSLY